MNERVIKNPNFKSNGEFHRNLMSRGKGAKDWSNTHTEVEHLGGGKFAASIGVGHRVFFDKADDNKPKKHKLTDERPSKDYVLIQGASCCVEVHPYYAKFFDVQHEEVRLYEERWVCQRLFKTDPEEWRDVDVYNPVIAVEEYSEPAGDVVKATVTYATDYGTLTVEYFQRDGNNLKHNVTFKNTGGEETFRVLQKWSGITSSKVKADGIEHPIGQRVKSKSLVFSKAEVRLKENNQGLIMGGQVDFVEIFTGNRKIIPNERVVIEKDGLKIVVRDYGTALKVDGESISGTSLLPNHIRVVEDCPDNARVFVGGLGLGVFLLPLACSDKTVEVIVCEKDQRVIDNVAPFLRQYLSEFYPDFNAQLHIISGDAGVEVTKHGQFDWILENFLYGRPDRDDYTTAQVKEISLPYLTERGVFTSFRSQREIRVPYFVYADINMDAPRGLKADFLYGNWKLPPNKSLYLDPDTATLDDPTEDGYIELTAGPTYVRNNTSTVIVTNEHHAYVGEGWYSAYVEWDVSGIPVGSNITKLEFRYEGVFNGSSSGTSYFRAMANRPSTSGDQTVYDDARDGTAYLSVAYTAWPEVGANKDVGGATGPAWNVDPSSDLEAALAQGWFAFGMTSGGSTNATQDSISSEEYVTANPKPTLYVEYTPPAGLENKSASMTAKMVGAGIL